MGDSPESGSTDQTATALNRRGLKQSFSDFADGKPRWVRFLITFGEVAGALALIVSGLLWFAGRLGGDSASTAPETSGPTAVGPTDPPVTDPPMTVSPVTVSPVTDPPVTDPPVTTVQAGLADLTVAFDDRDGFTWLGVRPDDGPYVVKAEAQICNRGETDAGPFVLLVEYEVEGENFVTDMDPVVVEGVPAGRRVTVSVVDERIGLGDAIVTVRAEVDTCADEDDAPIDCDVPELNADNNTAEAGGFQVAGLLRVLVEIPTFTPTFEAVPLPPN